MAENDDFPTQCRTERDGLDELIEDFEQVHGPADPEVVAAKRAELTGGPPEPGGTC